MNCLLVVPVTGHMELIMYETDPVTELKKRLAKDNLVTVNLATDNTPVGTVTFAVGSGEINETATAITGMVSGAYIRVEGIAGFVIAEQAALAVMMKIAGQKVEA